MRAERILRAALPAALALLVVLPFAWRRQADPAAPLRLARPLTAGDVRRALTTPLLVRDAPTAPDAAELQRLQAVAAHTPLLVVLRPTLPALAAEAPAGVRTGRAAALPFRVRGRPGDTLRVRLRDRLGVLDSARAALDSAGEAAGAFRVRARQAGWQEWTVETGEQRRTVAAWADSADAPRVLVHAGMPGWESRFVVRALEEAGARVSARYDLGRGLAVAAGGEGLGAAALARVDVVLVMDGAPLSAAQAAALAAFAERGGGVLLAGDRAGTAGFGLVRGAGRGGPLDGATIDWRLPAELAPLPAARLRATAASLGAALPGAEQVAAGPGGALLVTRPLGAGRAAALGLADSWRWRMEAGAVEAHREFWRALVDYLAGAGAAPAQLSALPALPAVGGAVEIALWDRRPGTRAATVQVETPDGERHALALRASGDGVLRAGYVPARPGVYRVVLPGGAAVTAFRAGRGGEGGWARAALLAARSGGAAVPPESAAAALRRLADTPAPGVPWRWLAGLGLLLLAAAGWTLRRLRGRP